jgi:uncharacterized coiled-coil protein SlyX
MMTRPFIAILILACTQTAYGQTAPQESTQQRLQRLSDAVTQVQAQMTAYQNQLQELHKQLAALQSEMNTPTPVLPVSSSTATGTESTTAALEEMRERQAIAESQITTHEQTKVETESKYPLRLTGLILLNTFVNTRHVDDPIVPTYALNGGGTTGLSIRQTVLGLNATGPHLFGAASHADIHIDFFGSGSQQTYGGAPIPRLRTAHASLTWKNTEAFFSLDRALLAPNVPTSLVATAQPNLSWNGDLWTWNTQVGVRHEEGFTAKQRLQFESAFIDVQDPLLPSVTATTSATRAQRSRWPGLESRVGYSAGDRDTGLRFGVGQYFSPHRTVENYRFNAWAITADLRVPVGNRVQITSNLYRGAGLGGLGGGGYVDYFYPVNTEDVARPLRDVGGWIQASIKASTRLQFNTGFGIDDPFAADVRAASFAPGLSYSGLTKNRSTFSNVIVSPSGYLQFSLEYRRLWSNYSTGPVRSADAIGVAAGYRF